MKFKMLTGNDPTDILIFFNGWGMDENPFNHLATGRMDVLMLFDYSDLTLPVNLENICGNYKRIHLAAWSLGVWAAATTLEHSPLKLHYSIAINGTVTPISGENGIPPEIFQATLNSWNDLSRKKFNRRMCATPEILKVFEANPPERTASEQLHELQEMAKTIFSQVQPPAVTLFNKAVIGTEDRIFPPANQLAAWSRAGIPNSSYPFPHYPFSTFTQWQELLNFA